MTGAPWKSVTDEKEYRTPNGKRFTPPNEELSSSPPLVSPTRGQNTKVGRKLEKQAREKITGEDRKRADFATGKKRFTEGK